MGALFTALWKKLADILTWLGEFWVEIFKAGWDFLTDIVCWVFDKGLDLAVSAMQALDVSAITANLSAWGSLPGEVLGVLGTLGVGTAAGIISAAITIRLGMQLIPFVRLGS